MKFKFLLPLILVLGLGVLAGCGAAGSSAAVDPADLTVSYGLVQAVDEDVLHVNLALDTSAESTDDWHYGFAIEDLAFDKQTEFIGEDGQSIKAGDLKINQLLQLEMDGDKLVRAIVIGVGPEGTGCCG